MKQDCNLICINAIEHFGWFYHTQHCSNSFSDANLQLFGEFCQFCFQETFAPNAKYPSYAAEFPSFMQQFTMLKFGLSIQPLTTSSNFLLKKHFFNINKLNAAKRHCFD